MIKFSSQWSALVSSNSSSGWLVCNDGPWAFSGPLVSTLFLAVGSLCSNPCRKYPFLLFFFLTAFSCLGALWQRGQGLPYSGLGLVSKRLYMAQPVPPGLETISSSIKKVFLFEAPYALRDVLTT